MGRIRLAHVRASALLLSFVGPAAAVGPHNCGADGLDPADRPTDCAWRALAVEYGSQIAGAHVGPSIHDALEIGRLCPSGLARPEQVAPPRVEGKWLDAPVVLHVSAEADGSGDGTRERPLTLVQARDRVRSVDPSQRPPTTVLLSGGTHFLGGKTLELGPQDGGRPGAPVVWAAAPGEEAVISGAAKLPDLTWTKWSGSSDVWVADLPVGTPTFKSLYVGGDRYWPARTPNGDPRFNLFPDTYSTDCTWGDDMSSADGLPFTGGALTDLCSDPGSTTAGVPCHRNNTHFPDSPWFKGGWTCRFEPCEGCADYGDHYMCMHGQMSSESFNKTWAHPEVAAIDVLHDGAWGGWGFNVGEKSGDTLTFRNGGFQEQTGFGGGGPCGTKGRGGKCRGFFAEMVLEELDHPGEFFTAGSKLYVYPNTTGTAWQRSVEVGVSERLVALVGTQEAPVSHIQFHGISFTQSLPTFLGGTSANRSMAPGTGDWSIFKSGAVYLEGTDHVTVANCTFREIGGNALLMYAYNRWNTVADTEFVWLGDSAVALVGRAKGGLASTDGTDGNYPQDVLVTRNHIHENGVLTKQSSPFFQTVSCHNNITNNVMYNGPRAGINFNDGFGGGDLCSGNLVFNMVRETNDHGPLNTWDRGPYVTLRGATPGAASLTPAWRIIERNFLVNGGNWPLDHDDGSRYIIDRFNVVVYGGTKNYHGYEKQYYGNLFIRPDIGCGNDYCGENDAAGVTAPRSLEEYWHNNTCITAGSPYKGACDSPDPRSSTSMQYGGNTFLTPSGDATKLLVTCDGAGPSPAPPPAHCAASKTTCAADWHCHTCKRRASNPTDCMSCIAGYTFTKQYSDCTGVCKKSKASERAASPRPAQLSFDKWQAAGWDTGSVVGKWPAPSAIVELARALLPKP